MVVVALVLLSAVVCLYPSGLASIFTKDQVFSDRVVQASLALAAVMVTMNLTVALEVRTHWHHTEITSYKYCCRHLSQALARPVTSW